MGRGPYFTSNKKEVTYAETLQKLRLVEGMKDNKKT